LGWNPDDWKPWKRRIEHAILVIVVVFLLAIGVVLSVPANSFLDGMKKLLVSVAK